MGSIHVVVAGRTGAQLEAAMAAIQRQQDAPVQGARAVVGQAARDEAMAAAAAAGAEWLWVVDAGAVPADDAVGELIARVRPRDVLVMGLVVDPEGHARAETLPRAAQHDTEALVAAAAGGGDVPVQVGGLAHTLVRASAVRHHGPPPTRRFGPLADAVWTARLLHADDGRLAIGSRSVAVEPLQTAEPSWVEVARMLRTGVWTPGERLRALRARLAPQ